MPRVVLALAFLAIAQVASLSLARRNTVVLARLPDKEPAHKGGPQLGAEQADDESDPSDNGMDSPNSPVLSEEQKVAQTEDEYDPSDGGAGSPNSPVAAAKVTDKISKDEGKVAQDDEENDPSDGGAGSPNSPVAAEKVADKISKDEGKVTQDDEENDPSDGGAGSPNSPVVAEKVADKISKDEGEVTQDDDQGEDAEQDKDLSYQDSIEVPMEIPESIPRYGMDDKDVASAPETPADQAEEGAIDETVATEAAQPESKEASKPEAKEAAAQEGEQKAPEKAAIDGKKELAIDVTTPDQKLAGVAPPYKPNWVEARRAGSKNAFIQSLLSSQDGGDLNEPSPDWIR